jgi:hypothetical protein
MKKDEITNTIKTNQLQKQFIGLEKEAKDL